VSDITSGGAADEKVSNFLGVHRFKIVSPGIYRQFKQPKQCQPCLNGTRSSHPSGERINDSHIVLVNVGHGHMPIKNTAMYSYGMLHPYNRVVDELLKKEPIHQFMHQWCQ
jgi:hypothetical protein